MFKLQKNSRLFGVVGLWKKLYEFIEGVLQKYPGDLLKKLGRIDCWFGIDIKSSLSSIKKSGFYTSISSPFSYSDKFCWDFIITVGVKLLKFEFV